MDNHKTNLNNLNNNINNLVDIGSILNNENVGQLDLNQEKKIENNNNINTNNIANQ